MQALINALKQQRPLNELISIGENIANKGTRYAIICMELQHFKSRYNQYHQRYIYILEDAIDYFYDRRSKTLT